eukprot:Em0007g154a
MSSSRKKHKDPKASKKHRHEEKADWPLPQADGGKVRLTELFGHIEKEFDQLRSENAALMEKVELLTDRLNAVLAERALERIPEVPVSSTDPAHSPASHPVPDPSLLPSSSQAISPRCSSPASSPNTYFLLPSHWRALSFLPSHKRALTFLPNTQARPTLTVEWAQMAQPWYGNQTQGLHSLSTQGTVERSTVAPSTRRRYWPALCLGDCFGHVWRYLPPCVWAATATEPRRETEKERLRQLIDGLVWFEPTLDELHLYMDGGVAIIDQWIAAHSRHFVGTGHSTFSFRIREDRQLMGFSRESTFNSLCGDKPGEEGDIISCEQPSYWPMVEGTTPPREDL